MAGDRRGVGRRGDPAVQFRRHAGADPEGVARPPAVRIDGLQRSRSQHLWRRRVRRADVDDRHRHGHRSRNRSSTAASSCCGAPTPSSPTCTSGRWCSRRSVAARRSSSSIRFARARLKRPTGTCQIRPGSDAALALAMMHVMIRDGLVDHEYVSQHAVGYDALAERVQQYSPARCRPRSACPSKTSSGSHVNTRRRSRRCCGR